MKIGTTFSHRELTSMGLDWREAWAECLDFGFQIIRLAAYWDEIESDEGVYDLAVLQSMLADCQERGIGVHMVVGMKAPRWPEYYLPSWLNIEQPAEAERFVLRFVEQVVGQLKEFECIEVWQVENEPLDPSGPNKWVMPVGMLKKEVDVVRQLGVKGLVGTTAWGNSLSRRSLLPVLSDLSDVVGIDLYYKVPLGGLGRWLYWGPADRQSRLRGLIGGNPKPVYIAELQGEAWEGKDKDKWQRNPGSINPEELRKNWRRAEELGVDVVLWWGYEYWWWRKQKGWSDLWDAGWELVEGVNSGRVG